MLTKQDINIYKDENRSQPFRCDESVATSFSLGTKANDIQHGGNHYKKYGDLQPWDVITQWQLGYLEGTALKYIARWKDKGGVEDLRKAGHFIQKAIEVYTAQGTK